MWSHLKYLWFREWIDDSELFQEQFWSSKHKHLFFLAFFVLNKKESESVSECEVSFILPFIFTNEKWVPLFYFHFYLSWKIQWCRCLYYLFFNVSMNSLRFRSITWFQDRCKEDWILEGEGGNDDSTQERKRRISCHLLISLIESNLNAISINSLSRNSSMNSFGFVLSLGSEGNIVWKWISGVWGQLDEHQRNQEREVNRLTWK